VKKLTLLKKAAIGLLFLIQTQAHAYTNYYEYSDTQPASVSATLNVSCKDAFGLLEKKMAPAFAKAPFLNTVESLSIDEWKEDSNTSNQVVESREQLLTFTTTVQKDFPPTLFTAKSTRYICKDVNTDPNMTCNDSYNLVVAGNEAKLYQKVIELGKASNPFESFSITFSMNSTNTTTCSFSSSLSILNSAYLISRPHLTKGLDPTVIESTILKGFTQWMKSNLDQLEGK